MAIFRLFPTRDTSITNVDPGYNSSVSITASNVGASEILNLYKTSDGQATASVLVQFDLTQIPAAALGAGAEYRLRLRDAQHAETIPSEFTAVVFQVSRSWNEGKGLDMDFYTDLGAANWFQASLSASWSASGGDFRGTFDPISSSLPVPFFSGFSASCYFDTGHEDLEANVDLIVGDWLANGSNFGFYIAIDPFLSGADYYIKKFHSRQTHFPAKRPSLDILWSDWTGSLSTSSFFVATSPTSPWSGSYLDPRLSATMSGTVVSVTNSLVDPTGALIFSLYDLRPVYDRSSVPILHMSARLRDWDAATTLSASSALTGTVFTNLYYRVVDTVTDEVLVPFGSGSVPYTKLSWDDAGNYFAFDMSILPTSSLMRFDFTYRIGSRSIFVPGDDFTFRISGV